LTDRTRTDHWVLFFLNVLMPLIFFFLRYKLIFPILLMHFSTQEIYQHMIVVMMPTYMVINKRRQNNIP